MGYMTRGGRIARGRTFTLMPPTLVTEAAFIEGVKVELGDKSTLRCAVTATGLDAEAGETFGVSIYTAPTDDEEQEWLPAIPTINSGNTVFQEGTTHMVFTGLHRWIRVRVNPNNCTPTVSIVAEAI